MNDVISFLWIEEIYLIFSSILGVLVLGETICRGENKYTCEMYDNETCVWTDFPAPRVYRHCQPGLVIQETLGWHRIYIFGGSLRYSGPIRSCEYINIGDTEWSWIKADMSSDRYGTAAVLFDNQSIVICGGNTGFKTISDCELFDTVSETFSTFPDMNSPRSHHIAVSYQNSIVVLGGRDERHKRLDTCEQFNKTESMWEPFPNPNCELLMCGATVVGEAIYLLIRGKYHTENMYMFDGISWASIGYGPGFIAISTLVMVPLDSNFIVFCENTCQGYVYDTITKEWMQLPLMKDHRCHIYAVSF